MKEKTPDLKAACSVASLSVVLYVILRSLCALPGLWYVDLLTLPAFLLCVLCLSATPLCRRLPKQPPRVLSARAFAWTLALPAVVVVVMLLARGTSALGAALGYTDDTAVSGPFLQAALVHALMPAVCEECLFRGFLPALLAPYGRRGSVVISAVLFALLHAPILHLPYALAAGLLLGAVAGAARSPLPTVVIHLANNLLSLFLLARPDLFWPVCGAVAALAALGLCGAVTIRRRPALGQLREALSDDGTTRVMCRELVALPTIAAVLFFLVYSVAALF